MSLKIIGRITEVLEIETGTSKAGKDWRKQNFIIDTAADFNPLICFQVFGDEKIAMLEGLKGGQEIEVHFNVSSREFNGKYYHNIDAWKINATGNEDQQQVTQQAENQDDSDDLPF